MSDYYKIKLLKKEVVAKYISRFTFERNESFDFMPGNYVMMFNNKNEKVAGLSRPFTISSTPKNNSIEFIIKKVGKFTTELFNLNEGETLDIEAPLGNMSYKPEHYGKNIIFIAGGTGITPYISITNFAKKEDHKTNFKLFYAVKEKEELILKDATKTILSNEGKRIDKEFLKENITDEELNNSIIFVCGPPPMENAVEQALIEIGAKNILREK